MRNLLYKSGMGIGLVVSHSSVVLAATTQEDLVNFLYKIGVYGSVLFVVVVFVLVYFMKQRDNHKIPVGRLFEEGESVHSVGPNALITECVRKMTAEKIGALVVIDGERLVGIFTERDALNKVLATGLEPSSTKVSDVMTKDPYCIPPTTTIGEAMELITRRRFRHLPVVKNGKVLAVISSGDLTHWLVRDQVGEVQELVDLAARS